MIIILDPFFITLTIFLSKPVSPIQAKFSFLTSNLILFFPDLAVIEFLVLYWYPEVILTSSLILSAGLKLINNLASLGFFFGDCKTGFD